MRTNLLPFFALLLFSVSFSACEPIEDIKEEIEEGGEFSATVNGENFTAKGILVTAQYQTTASGITTLAIGAAKLPLDGVTKGFALAAVSIDSTEIAAGDVFTGDSIEKVAAGEYSVDSDTEDIKAGSSQTKTATITITSIDFSTKLVSGTFSFDGTDDDDPNTVYEVRDGVFTDVVFR